MSRTWNATAVIAEKVNNWLRILMAIATLLPAVMIGIAALGGEHGQFTLPQGTWFIVVMAAAVIALVACALLQFFFGRRGSGGILGVLFLGLAVVPFWAALDHGKTVFDVGIPIQILAFIPIVALIIAAIWIGPLKLIGIGMIPGAANQVLGGVEAIGRRVKAPVRLPRVPTTGRMLTWLALALVADAMLGIYLSFVTIADEPRLILPLILVTVALALLTAVNKAGGFRVLLWIALIVITLIFALGGQKKTAEKMDKAATWLASHPKELKGGMPSGVNTYNPNAICPMPVATAVDGSINNPLGIKFYGDLIKTVAEDSGIAAKDGGTFAKFPTPEKGIDAGKQLLRSETGIYDGQTTDWAMHKWSNKGYGAEVAAGTGIDSDAIVNRLSDEQMDALLAAMAKREGVSPAATALPYVNPNDHRNDPGGEFTVEVPHGCFSSNADWVMPATNRGSWIEDIVSDDPNAQVAIWLSGMSHPVGPYTRATFPHDYHWNEWRLQAMGEGSVKVRYVYTAATR